MKNKIAGANCAEHAFIAIAMQPVKAQSCMAALVAVSTV